MAQGGNTFGGEGIGRFGKSEGLAQEYQKDFEFVLAQ
jgi:hypothetical protein